MSRTIQVTFDCADPERLSRFWAAVLGYVNPGPPGCDAATGQDVFDAWHEFLGQDRRTRDRVELAGPPPRTPRARARGCSSSSVPEGKIVKNRVHLDVRAAPGLQADERMAALEAECERLVGLGATRRAALRARAAAAVGAHRDAGPGGQRVLPRLRWLRRL